MSSTSTCPTATMHKKMGLDDCLAAGYTPQQLMAMATPELREPPQIRPLTDLGNAERLIDRHGDNLLYCARLRQWYGWEGKRWEPDRDRRVDRLVKETVRSIEQEASFTKDSTTVKAIMNHARCSEAEGRINAMLGLAKSEERIIVRPEELDQDPWLLNVENGTLDLRTGGLREHSRQDRITRIAPVDFDPDARSPTWQSFLDASLPDPEVQQFVQRAVGYSLFGSITDHVFFFLFGPGKNGKSTFLRAVETVFGEYGSKARAETFMANRPANAIPNDIAALWGARLVTVSEVQQGQALNEALLKDLTGGDLVTARFLNKEFFSYRPTFIIWMCGNHLPYIRGTDMGIWRRVHVIPFEVTIREAEVDRDLPSKLASEREGILAWAVRGCLDWQKEELRPPEAVLAAVSHYRTTSGVAAFLDEICDRNTSESMPATALFREFCNWLERRGLPPRTQQWFGRELTALGIRAEHRRDGDYRLGAIIRAEPR